MPCNVSDNVAYVITNNHQRRGNSFQPSLKLSPGHNDATLASWQILQESHEVAVVCSVDVLIHGLIGIFN